MYRFVVVKILGRATESFGQGSGMPTYTDYILDLQIDGVTLPGLLLSPVNTFGGMSLSDHPSALFLGPPSIHMQRKSNLTEFHPCSLCNRTIACCSWQLYDSCQKTVFPTL